jgi:hypothetical protein
MRSYTCYFLDCHIAAVEVIECGGDDEAGQRADALRADRPKFNGAEVWDRGRRVSTAIWHAAARVAT